MMRPRPLHEASMPHRRTFRPSWLVVCAAGWILASCDNSTPVQAPENPDQPFETAEQRLGQWVWMPVAASVCRDGSSTGIGVRLQAEADDLLIYLQGGGACYDQRSCQDNAAGQIAGANYDFDDFSNWVATFGNQGVFNLNRSDNPMRGWNHVYIAYCSGDLHAGMSTDVTIDGVPEPQQFLGRSNLAAVLDVVAPYFDSAARVVLAGASAGGFGVMLNYAEVADTFAPKPVTALVDAAPLLSIPGVETSCFEEKVRTAFNLEFPSTCPTCSDPVAGGMVGLYRALADAYPNARFALATADADLAGVVLLNRESVDCQGGGVNIINYRLGLLNLQSLVLAPSGQWSSFYWSGIQHTCTQSNALFYNNPEGGHTVASWFAEVLDGNTLSITP